MTILPPLTHGIGTAEFVVAACAEQLRTFTRVAQFRDLAVAHGFGDRTAFDRFATALLEIAEIDFEGVRQREIRRRASARRLAGRAASGPRLVLYSAATMNSFLIAGADDRILWHDVLPGYVTRGDGARAAEMAAGQAIWLAGAARVEWGADAASLQLVLARGRGVDRDVLRDKAAAVAIDLHVAVQSLHHPAAEQCHRPGPVHWTTADLARLYDQHGQDIT
ncbi:hypothetical protein [Nocardia sp. NPDC057227]|uniref:hypothetical protein n=1 Tax=Nocardia sp. NPDC057227 TaxID=3346056 RepID=UPI00362A2C2F